MLALFSSLFRRLKRSDVRALRCRILDAIWEVRWDAEGQRYWEISSLQLWNKLGEGIVAGKLHVTLSRLEDDGLIVSRYEPHDLGSSRIVHLTPLGIAQMLQSANAGMSQPADQTREERQQQK
jgi:hypothetical protein